MASESAFLSKSSKYKIYIIIPLPTIYVNQPPKYSYLGKSLSLPGVCFFPSKCGENNAYLFPPPKASQGGVPELRITLCPPRFPYSLTHLKWTAIIWITKISRNATFEIFNSIHKSNKHLLSVHGLLKLCIIYLDLLYLWFSSNYSEK